MVVDATSDVGSTLTQLANKPTKVIIISTVSRPQNQKRVREAGTHHMIDHNKPLTEELARIGVREVMYVASLNNTGQHYSQIIAALTLQGKLALIDDPQFLDARPLRTKSISLHQEFTLTRSMFTTHSIVVQRQLLTRVAQLISGGTLHTTLGGHFGMVTTANVQKTHTQTETGHSVSKIVLRGF